MEQKDYLMTESVQKTEQNTDLETSFQEMIYQKYLNHTTRVRDFFTRLNVTESIVLHAIGGLVRTSPAGDEKVYLKDLASAMQLNIAQTSKLVGALQDNGLLTWAHDGNGSDGTYVIVTESGRKLLQEQNEKVKFSYDRVVERFGSEQLQQLISLTRQLEQVMDELAQKQELLPEN